MGRAKKNQVCFPSYKVKPETIESLKQTALESGYIYGNSAAMGEFLDRLATVDPDLLKAIIKRRTNPYGKASPTDESPVHEGATRQKA
jgi:hypothetical protein